MNALLDVILPVFLVIGVRLCRRPRRLDVGTGD